MCACVCVCVYIYNRICRRRTSVRKDGESVATNTEPFGCVFRKASTYGSYSRGPTGRPDAALARYFPLSVPRKWTPSTGPRPRGNEMGIP